MLVIQKLMNQLKTHNDEDMSKGHRCPKPKLEQSKQQNKQ